MNIGAINTNYRQIGDVSLRTYEDEFRRVNSPMLAGAKATREAAMPHSALFLAQAWLENQYETTGHIIKPNHHNPVSLRPEVYGKTGPYASGIITASDGGQFLTFRSDADCAREWKRRLFDDPGYKGGVYAETNTLAEMLGVYAPSGDVHPVTGKDNADIGYLDTVVRMLTRYAAMEAEGTGMAIGNRPLRIALGVGHANSSGGNAYELVKNREVVAELIRMGAASRGFEIRCWTPNNGQGNYPGPLDAAAAQVRTWVQQGWLPDVVHELHHEGTGTPSIRGGFVIYPDSWGLVGRKAGGDYTDVDVRTHGPEMARIITGELGVPLRGSGVMSEKSTDVGARLGARLGFFGAVSDPYFRDNACVFITEAATYTNPTDRAIMDSPSFARKEALGILKAYAALARRKGWTFPYEIVGDASPTPAPVGFKAGDTVEATDRLNVRQGYGLRFPVVKTLNAGEQGRIGKDGDGRYMVTADGYTWLNIAYAGGSGWAASSWLKIVKPAPGPEPTPVEPPTPSPGYTTLAIAALDEYDDTAAGQIPATVPFTWNGRSFVAVYVGDQWKATRVTPRYGTPDTSNKVRTGVDIPKDTVFDVMWLVYEPGNGKQPIMGRTPWATFVKMDETIRVGDELSR